MAVREAGYSIPEDFAVVGYDDIPAATFACPPLTTVRSHPFEQGKITGETAIALVNGKIHGRETSIVPLELIIRDSCGASLRKSHEPKRS
jgi:DNA-binding LacI/PurR family transcriptional regulator